jgi:hypothetical protein
MKKPKVINTMERFDMEEQIQDGGEVQDSANGKMGEMLERLERVETPERLESAELVEDWRGWR